MVGVLSTVFSVLSKNRSDLELEIGKALRQKRIEVYSELFGYMHKIAIFYGQGSQQINYGDIKNLQDSITKWYYENEGGLFMSYSSQEAYINFQRIVTEIIKNRTKEFLWDKKDIDKKDKDKIKIIGYIFRLNVLEDVGVNVTKFVYTIINGQESD